MDRNLVLQSGKPLAQASPSLLAGGDGAEMYAQWFAVYTAPQHEKSALRHLSLREVNTFLPTYVQERVWKNRQRVQTILPLFPGYLFVRIVAQERGKVLSSPGVLSILGGPNGRLSVPDSTIEFLRSDLCRNNFEPYRDIPVGQRVRIKDGPMREVIGTLVRKKNALRFVVSIELINQHASLEVNAENLEPVVA